MDLDRLERLDSLGRYERYLRYMQLIDSMDNLEGMCDSDISERPVRLSRRFKRKRVATKPPSNANVSKASDEDNISDDNFDSDFDNEGDDDITFSDTETAPREPPRKKIDVENPYRGLRDAANPLETMDATEFLNSYKLSKKTVYDIMELIKQRLITHNNRGVPVPPLIMLLITIKYLTAGTVQKEAMKGVSQATISRINTRVTKLIMCLQHRYIKFPEKSEIDTIKMKFYERGKFPDTIGCLGTTHVGVRVKGIKDYNAGFVNENGYHSVRVQLIVGPDGEILDIVSKSPGATHENFIFNSCEIYHKFHMGEIQGVLIGNQEYNPTTIHQLMLQDEPRMLAYKTAIMNNKSYINGKTVMDVGAGSGVLSFFCAMAGAKKVYAVEASNLSKLCTDLVKANKFESVIEVIHSKVEDFSLPNNEKVDIIVSEWMGFYLLHEGMLDSVIYARDAFLKPDGHMFPESATVYVAPCSVPSLYSFWENVHGVKMDIMGSTLRKNKSGEPKVLKVDEIDLLSEKVAFCWIDLKEDNIFELDFYSLTHVIGASKAGRYQGMCIWFECQFPALCEENLNPVVLSTSPSSPLTHWKQTVIVLPGENALEEGEPIAWELNMKRSPDNNRRYDLQLTMLDPSTETHPTPCSCYMTKCIVVRTFLDQHPDGKETFGNQKIDNNMEMDETQM